MKRIISSRQLHDLKGVPLGNDQLQDLESRGEFPKRVRLTARTYGYVEAEIDTWLESRIAQRDIGAAGSGAGQ